MNLFNELWWYREKLVGCCGRAVESTRLELWCFWSAECGLEALMFFMFLSKIPWLICPSDGILSHRSHVLGLVVYIKEPRNTFCGRVGGLTPVFLVHTANTLVYRFPQATVTKFTYGASSVSLPEMCKRPRWYNLNNNFYWCMYIFNLYVRSNFFVCVLAKRSKLNFSFFNSKVNLWARILTSFASNLTVDEND